MREEHRYEGSKMAMSKYLWIITLNVNGLNAPIKRHRVAEWIRNHDPIRNQDGGIGRHTAPPRTTRTDRESNG